jgi:plastocyanin domain-containing protein
MIVVNLVGLAVIVLIAWWFWFYKPAEVSAIDDEIVILVEAGAYSPARIKLAANSPVTLNFLRKDPSPCAEVLMIPELDINETLAVNKITPVQLPALEPGEYAFHCQMQMYRGTLSVA